MTMTPDQAAWFSDTFGKLVANVSRAILGKNEAVRLAWTCMLSEGHLLLEDFPGTGKTSLARAMAQSVRGSHNRIQFTPDLLPSDVTGVTIYDQGKGIFEFHEGPIFASIVLADEINRASPKTQAALLEVMEESRVTVDGVTHTVGEPFMVIATQNPIEQAGTYRLPEAQLDRFLMKTSLGYPDHTNMVRILAGGGSRSRSHTTLPEVITTQAVADMSRLGATVHLDPSILEYISKVLEATRTAPEIVLGASVRAGLALVRASQTWAASQGRHFVIPDDVKMLVEPVLAHRFVLDAEAEFSGATATGVLARIVEQTPPPQARRAV